jgi:broad specificity phosphatase PhoE
MHLIFVRHGESTNNVLLAGLRAEAADPADYNKARYDAEKSNDPALSALGKQQAQRLGAWMPRYISSMAIATRATRVLCSPMERALGTADEIAASLDKDVEVWSDLHETKGCWSGGVGSRGSTGPEIVRRHGVRFSMSAAAPVAEAGWWSAPDGSPRARETGRESYGRAQIVAARLRQMALDAREPTLTIVVTHGQWVSLLMQALLFPGSALDAKTRRFGHDCTGISSLVLPGLQHADGAIGSAQLQCSNRSHHLDAAPQVRRTPAHFHLSGFNEHGKRPAEWAPAQRVVGAAGAQAAAASATAAAAASGAGRSPLAQLAATAALPAAAGAGASGSRPGSRSGTRLPVVLSAAPIAAAAATNGT